MTTKNLLPSVIAHKMFTDKQGRPWTKFLMSDKKEHIEQGHMQAPFMVTMSTVKGKKHISVWSVAK
jgi:hypothetical protein